MQEFSRVLVTQRKFARRLAMYTKLRGILRVLLILAYCIKLARTVHTAQTDQHKSVTMETEELYDNELIDESKTKCGLC
jgi:hypothetical protein